MWWGILAVMRGGAGKNRRGGGESMEKYGTGKVGQFVDV